MTKNTVSSKKWPVPLSFGWVPTDNLNRQLSGSGQTAATGNTQNGLPENPPTMDI